MEKKYLFFLTLFLTTIVQSQINISDVLTDGIPENVIQNGINPTVSNIEYNDSSNGCTTKSFKVTWSAVWEYYIGSYQISIYDNSSNKWILVKSIPKANRVSYSTSITNLSGSWAKNDKFEIKVSPGLSLENWTKVSFKDGTIKEIPSKKSTCETGPAILIVDRVVIKGKDDSKIKTTLYDSQNKASYTNVKFYRSEDIEIEVSIKNVGNSKASGIKGLIGYNNNSSSFSVFTDCKIYDLNDTKSLEPGSTKKFKIIQYISPVFQGAGCPNVTYSGSFWFLPEQTAELGEVVTFIVNSRSGKSPTLLSDVQDYRFQTNLNNFTQDQIGYTVDLFNLLGEKVLTKVKVFSVYEENLLIGELPKGIYIIKSKNGDRKIAN